MTEQPEKRPSSTRLDIICAAAHEFAVKPYSLVNLDDILANADVTKTAMYTHFTSKHALARAVIEHRAASAAASFTELQRPPSSALESLISATYYIATSDIGDEQARAGLNLLESIGRFDGFQARIVAQWVRGYAQLARQAIDDGDVSGSVDPDAVARTLVSTYLGLRQTSAVDEPKTLIGDLEAAWLLALPGFVEHARIDYVRAFIRRRSAIAIRNTAPLGDGAL